MYLEGAELLSGDYVTIPFRFLEGVAVTSVTVERFKREHPELARQPESSSELEDRRRS